MKKTMGRLIALTLVLALGLAGLAGCGQQGESKNVKTDPFAQLQDRGYVVMGMDDTFAPWAFVTKTVNWSVLILIWLKKYFKGLASRCFNPLSGP